MNFICARSFPLYAPWRVSIGSRSPGHVLDMAYADSSGGPLMICRTSMGMFPGRPSGPRRGRCPRGDPVGLLRTFHLDDPVSGEKLFGFRKDSIGNWRSIASRADDLGLVGERQALGRNERSRVPEFLAESLHECHAAPGGPASATWCTTRIRPSCRSSSECTSCLSCSFRFWHRAGASSCCSRIRFVVFYIAQSFLANHCFALPPVGPAQERNI